MPSRRDLREPLKWNLRGNPVVWLTWAARANGLVDLRAISLTRMHHDAALVMTREDARHQKDTSPMRVVRVWGEETEAEHCFGACMTREGLALMNKVVPNEETKKIMGRTPCKGTTEEP